MSSRSLPIAISVTMRAATSKYRGSCGSANTATAEYTKATLDPRETRVSMLALPCRAVFSAPRWKTAPTQSHTGSARASWA